jgi:hypothetical protein
MNFYWVTVSRCSNVGGHPIKADRTPETFRRIVTEAGQPDRISSHSERKYRFHSWIPLTIALKWVNFTGVQGNERYCRLSKKKTTRACLAWMGNRAAVSVSLCSEKSQRILKIEETSLSTSGHGVKHHQVLMNFLRPSDPTFWELPNVLHELKNRQRYAIGT